MMSFVACLGLPLQLGASASSGRECFVSMVIGVGYCSGGGGGGGGGGVSPLASVVGGATS